MKEQGNLTTDELDELDELERTYNLGFIDFYESKIDIVVKLWKCQAWRLRQLKNWKVYVDSRLYGGRPQLHVNDRRRIVARLHDNGLSNRAIADVLGVHSSTIDEDVKLYRAGNPALHKPPPAQTPKPNDHESSKPVNEPIIDKESEKPITKPEKPYNGPTVSDEELLEIKRRSIVANMMSNYSHAVYRLTESDKSTRSITFELNPRDQLDLMNYLSKIKGKVAMLEDAISMKVNFDSEIDKLLGELK